MLGLQETRNRKSYIREVGTFVCASSAADSSGNYGCEVWVNRKFSWATVHGKSLYVGRDDVTIIHSEPRCLVVVVCVFRIRIYIVSAHASHVAKQECEQWWSDLTKTIGKLCNPSD